VNAPVDNRRRQHNVEVPADKQQRHHRVGARGANEVSWQRGEWKGRQQEGGGGAGKEEEEAGHSFEVWTVEKMSQCFFLKNHTGDNAVCPDGLFVPVEMSRCLVSIRTLTCRNVKVRFLFKQSLVFRKEGA
jgi:hypothetical protein